MKESRLFRIVYFILEKGRVTAPELAEKFEVSVRTVYRDIDVIRSAGERVFPNTGAVMPIAPWRLAQSGKVFDEYGRDIARFNRFQHLLESGAVPMWCFLLLDSFKVNLLYYAVVRIAVKTSYIFYLYYVTSRR